MHRANLMRRDGFTKKINGGHLTAENAFLVQFWCRSNVTFIEWLETSKKSNKHTNSTRRLRKIAYAEYFFSAKRRYITSKGKIYLNAIFHAHKRYLPRGIDFSILRFVELCVRYHILVVGDILMGNK